MRLITAIRRFFYGVKMIQLNKIQKNYIFNEAVEEVLEVEGGYVDDPSDSGGETNYGITKKVALRFGYTGAMKSMPRNFAIRIYKELYWDELELDTISKSAPSIATKLFDIGVNMGTGRAAEFLQRALNVLNRQGKDYSDIAVDRDIGSVTLRALGRYLSRRNGEGETVLLRALICLQGAFYLNLAERRQKDERFVYGWILNRISI